MSFKRCTTFAVSEKGKTLPHPSTKTSSSVVEDAQKRRGPFPVMGLLALVGAVLTILLSLILLLVVQGPANDANKWDHQNLPKPAAWLSIILSATSFLLHAAFSEGAAVTWWSHARRQEVTVQQLHDLWQHSTSTPNAIGATILHLRSRGLDPLIRILRPTSNLHQRRFSYVALTCMIVATNPLIGVLLQSAVVVHSDALQASAEFTVPMGQEFPFVTATTDEMRHDVLSFSPTWAKLTQNGVAPGTTYADLENFDTGCKDTCYGEVEGLGFKMNCSDTTIPYNITSTFNDSGFKESGYKTAHCGPDWMQVSGQVVLNTEVIDVSISPWSVPYYTPDRIIMKLNTTWKNESAEVGALASRTCTFAPAIVKYPIMIKVNTPVAADQGLNSTLIYLDPSFDLLRSSFEVVSVDNLQQPDSAETFYQGVPALFAEYFNSTATLFYTNFTAGQLGKCGTKVSAGGLFAQQQLGLSNLSYVYNTTGGNGCFQSDPADLGDLILQDMQRMMFLISAYIPKFNITARADGDGRTEWKPWIKPGFHNVTGTAAWSEDRYHVIWSWYFAALGVTIAIAAAITPTFWGYWHLDRKATMTPFETARAFHAPLVEKAPVRTNSDDLLKKIGEEKIHQHFFQEAHNIAVLRAYLEELGV